MDSLSLAALKDELTAAIQGGRVQNAIQISQQVYALELYAQHRRQYLHLSVEPQSAQVFLSNIKPRRGTDTPSPLSQLFKKYLVGGGLNQITQPDLERLLIFEFSHPQGNSRLIIELIGTQPKLILCTADENRILALSQSQNTAKRQLLPGQAYQAPPPQNFKLKPEALNLASLESRIAATPKEKSLATLLTRQILGMSKLIAREAIFRAYGQIDLPPAQADNLAPLLTVLQAIFANLPKQTWQANAVFNSAGHVTRYAPIALTHLPNSQPIGSLSEAIRQTVADSDDGYAAVRNNLLATLSKAEKRLQRRQSKLAQDAAKLKNPDSFMEKGQAILSYSYQIKAGQARLSVPWTDGTLSIELDPSQTPAENAQRYFDRYQKAKRAATIIPEQQESVAQQLSYLEQLIQDVAMADTRPELDAIAQAIQEAGLGGPKRKPKRQSSHQKASKATKLQSPDGFVVWLGKNVRQNHHIVTVIASPNDIWLHARDVPGAHVLIPTASGEPPDSTLRWAAGVAAHYSKQRGERTVQVILTRRKHIRPVKGGPPGLVTVRQSETMQVAPLAPVE